jgi:hypothetical protein
MKERTLAMQNLLLELFWVLETHWEDAKTYAELIDGPGKVMRDGFDQRIRS